MTEYWKCKNCGRVNLGYVGTCGCGGLKADGTQASEEEYKNNDNRTVKKKWQCPNCLKMNVGDFCTCGYVKTRSDKYIDGNDNSTQISYTHSGINYKKIVLALVIIIGLIIGGKYILSQDHGIEGTYISYTNTVYNREAMRFVLKDGKYAEYIYKQPVRTGTYKYDTSTNTLTLEGWSTLFHYGKDVDGIPYICRPVNSGGYEYYYKQ